MAISLDRFFLFNPFAKFFKGSRVEEEKKEDQEIDNSQGVSQEEIDLQNFINYDYMSSPGNAITYVGIQFEQYFGSKRGRIQKYRQMSRYPIVNDALNQICDDAVVDNPEGDVINLEITEEIPEHIEDEIRKIWKYLTINVFKFNERGWDLFRKWLIEAEIYIELILNDEGDDIIGIKVLPSHTMMPIYRENRIDAFMQVNANSPEAVKGSNASMGNVDYAQNQNFSDNGEQNSIVFDKDQIAYSNYGDIGENNLDIRGFLESAIRPFNQLNNMEDSTVVAKLVRAPQRRIWNIYTGKMPKGKADEFVKQLANRYKKKLIYDPTTGAMDSAQNIQSLTEDYWFTRDINGNGTTVDTIGGDNSFDDMSQVKYFQENLYKSLMLPRSRWEDPTTSMYASGKSGEIQREEIKFARFVERLQRRFKYIVLDPFITLLRLRGIDERYINQDIFNVQFTKSNLFKEYKELELMESRLSILAAASQFIYNPNENPQGYFAPEFAMKRMFLMTEGEWQWNKELMDKIRITDENASGGSENQFGAPGESGGGFGGGAGGEFGTEGGESGGEAGEDTGAEAPVAGGEGGAEETPESSSFKITNKDSSILQEWFIFDESIKDRYKDKNLRNCFNSKK
jgi:hypothetical protein